MKILILIASLLFATSAFSADGVKKSDLAGSWYPQSGEELSSMIQGYLTSANPRKISGRIFAIISPHAGYRFSGPVAAYGYKEAQGQAVNTVIIVGFSHRKIFDGIAIYAKGAWKTPLGDVRIDEALAKELMICSPRIVFKEDLFTEENSIEMQVPFIQEVFKSAKIIPIAFGTQNYDDAETLSRALEATLKNRSEYLVVASTDLSHYHPYQEANIIDKHLMNLLKSMKARPLYDEAKLGMCELCGLMPVTAVLLAGERLGFNKIEILNYANSGDTAGGKDSVVGYLSAAIYKGDDNIQDQGIKGEGNMLNEAQRKELLRIARESIENFLKDGTRKRIVEKDPVLNSPMGAFVTLHEAGELRGCIGNMVGRGPLCQTVADMAREAATGDPRFPAVTLKELNMIEIEISVLSPLKKVSSYNEVKIPGDGVLVKKGFRSSVYLPQVANETGWNRDEFLTSLCGQKAGLAPDAWKNPDTEIYVFSAEVFGEKGGAR